MAKHGYGSRTNQWLTLTIPYVDDGKKVSDRKSEYTKAKKQFNLMRSKLIREQGYDRSKNSRDNSNIE